MPNEFKIKNGLVVDLGGAQITGSTNIVGSLTVTGGITGSLLGTASFASTASFVDVSGLNVFVQGGNSFGTQALIGTNDNNNLALETSGSIRMFISSSGNVGVGTSTPSASLNVRSAAVITDVAFFQSSANGLCLSFNGSRIGFQTAPGGAMFSPFFGFTQGSNVQIGLGNADASARLHVRGNGATSSTTGLRIENSNASASLVVLDNGNVGIGGEAETSPSYKLRVHGGLWATSFEQLQILNGTSGVGIIGFYDAGASLRLRVYGPHPSEAVKGVLALDRQDLSYTTLSNSIPHSASFFMDHPSFVIRSNNTSANSFFLQNYMFASGALFVTNQPAGGDTSFRFRPSASLTGSTDVFVINTAGVEVIGSGRITGSLTVTGSLNVTQGITGSLFGTASFATSSSRAVSASFASNAALAAEASFVPNTFTQGGNTFGGPATLGTNDTEDLRLISNGDATMVLSSNNETLIVGNTIIGTTNTSPLARLHIQSSGDTSATTALRIETPTTDPLLNVLDNGQIQFNNYTGPSSFTGTAAATLAVDGSGNVITITGGGGGAAFPFTGSAIITGSLTVTGSITNDLLSGSDDRVITATSDGRLKSTNQVIIQAYLDPNGTQASLLNNTSNWNVSGAYVGTTITDTYQGQKHYNTTHFFEAVDNNEWIRLLRV